MKTARRFLSRAAGALALSGLFLTVAMPAGAAQTTTVDARDLLVRLQRLERDLRDLQAETFRRPPGGPDAAAPPPPQGGMPDLSPMMRRIDEVGDSISRLTGQMEELNHQVDLLQQKTDRLQKEMDYQAQQASQAQAQQASDPDDSNVASLAPERGPDRGSRLAPPEGVLGQIPTGRNAPPPPPPPPGARAEFDSAMALLTRGQTVPASAAFRAFVDAHPDDDRAPVALYWAGDIAYSTKKDYEESARSFAELLKNYPTAQRAPEGMLKLGLSLLELGQVREGCAALAALPAKYPNASPAIATRARNERRDNKCR